MSFVSAAERRRAELFWADLVGEAAIAPETAGDATESADLRSWPALTSLPDPIVDAIIANRSAVRSRASDLTPAPNGYSYRGKEFAPSALCTPQEARNERLCQIITRFKEEMKGEGRTSAVGTGDRAGFTWGPGLAHGAGIGPEGGALEKWVNRFFAIRPEAKEALLDLGITLSGKTWKIVDTSAKVVKTGEEAIKYLAGRQPVDEKKRLLSIFINVAEQFGAHAAEAQWKITKELFDQNRPPQDVIDDAAWSPEAICYVIHAALWGAPFAGWKRFKTTGGDPRKILRLEVEYTGYYEWNDTFILVPPVKANDPNVTPSVTMLRNMGGRFMITDKVVSPRNTFDDAQKGDVWFAMPRGIHKSEFFVLRGVPKMYDPQKEIMDDIRSVHASQMSSLLAFFDKIRDKGGRSKGYKRLKAMRDYYASSRNPRQHAFGLRPRVAMDAVLHRREGESGRWILDDARRADLPDDQVELIKKKVGLN